MPPPQFVLDLRKKIGHDLLWLPGVTAAVFDEEGNVLLVRRSDNQRWTLVTGTLDPGEQPTAGAIREVYEETGVEATAEELIAVEAIPAATCATGHLVPGCPYCWEQSFPEDPADRSSELDQALLTPPREEHTQ